MRLALPRFYAIMDRSIRFEISLAELAGDLSRAGVRLIQLRAKAQTAGGLLAETKELLHLLPLPVSLIVNDRADVAQLAGAAGVHIGEDDLPVEAARQLLGPEKIIGTSTHSEQELERASKRPADYLAFGPIFPTSSKPDARPAVGLAGLRRARQRTEKPLVAIGGITPENAPEVLAAGAEAVAVIRGWLEAEDIAGRLEEFRRALGRLE